MQTDGPRGCGRNTLLAGFLLTDKKMQTDGPRGCGRNTLLLTLQYYSQFLFNQQIVHVIYAQHRLGHVPKGPFGIANDF